MTFICLYIFHLDALFSDWSTSPSLILLPSYYGPASFGLTQRFLTSLFFHCHDIMPYPPFVWLHAENHDCIYKYTCIPVCKLLVLLSNCSMKLSRICQYTNYVYICWQAFKKTYTMSFISLFTDQGIYQRDNYLNDI